MALFCTWQSLIRGLENFIAFHSYKCTCLWSQINYNSNGTLKLLIWAVHLLPMRRISELFLVKADQNYSLVDKQSFHVYSLQTYKLAITTMGHHSYWCGILILLNTCKGICLKKKNVLHEFLGVWIRIEIGNSELWNRNFSEFWYQNFRPNSISNSPSPNLNSFRIQFGNFNFTKFRNIKIIIII